jgi:hypothetical protein
METKTASTAKWPGAFFIGTNMPFVTIVPVCTVIKFIPVSSGFPMGRVPYDLPRYRTGAAAKRFCYLPDRHPFV